MTTLGQKKIEMFLFEGTPYGLRYVGISGKTIRTFAAPRTRFDLLLQRQEMAKAGVYILYGERDGKGSVYIGEADVLEDRLPAHRTKDFWTEIIVLTAQDETLDKAGVRYIESILVERVQADKQVDIEKGNTPRIKNLSEANVAVMNEIVEDFIMLLWLLGKRIVRFGQAEINRSVPELLISKDKIQARGRNTDDGFIVYERSTARKDLLSSANETVRGTQKALIERGILRDVGTHLVFMQDFLFTSPSSAASLILGRSSNGTLEWKTQAGRPLKALLSE